MTTWLLRNWDMRAAFRKFADVFRDPKVTYLHHEVKDLRIHRAHLEDVARFSAIVDDWCEIDGRPGT